MARNGKQSKIRVNERTKGAAKPQTGRPSGNGKPPKTHPSTSVQASSRPHPANPQPTTSSEPIVPIPLQQRLLTTFSAVLAPTLADPAFPATLQSIKAALYARDFEGAFAATTTGAAAEGPERLEAYAARWSPTRALCYLGILASLKGVVLELEGKEQHERHRRNRGDARDGDQEHDHDDGGGVPTKQASCETGGNNGEHDRARRRQHLRVVALGGGAAEVVAFGGLASLLRDGAGGDKHDGPAATACQSDRLEGNFHIHLDLIDTAPWDPVIARLHEGLTALPVASQETPLPSSGSPEALLPREGMSVHFEARDILAFTQSDIRRWSRGGGTAASNDLEGDPLLSSPTSTKTITTSTTTTTSITPSITTTTTITTSANTTKAPTLLVTLFFTLNELFTTSRARTTVFLYELTAGLSTGAQLLVVDSPGSYAETAIGSSGGGVSGGEEARRRYPMAWLLDHVLLGRRGGSVDGGGGEEGGEGGGAAKGERDGGAPPQWEKLVDVGSQWFRVPSALRYPIALEDMRYQLHLYRRL